MGIVLGVGFHRRRKRTARPVRLLRSLGQSDIEILLHQRREAEFTQAQHARRDHRVENFADRKIERTPEQAQIEIHSLQHDFPLGERSAERLQIERCERIDQHVLAVEGQLDETQLFEITVQTVGLGIDGDAIELAQPREDFREL